MKPSKSPFTFRLVMNVTQQDLIHVWVVQEHIKTWFHGVGLQNTLKDLDAFFKGTSICQHWIAYDQETPFGYL